MPTEKGSELDVLRFPDGLPERSCARTVQLNGGGTPCNLAFRSRAVPPLAEAVALRNEARGILVRLVVRLYIDQHDVKKLAA